MYDIVWPLYHGLAKHLPCSKVCFIIYHIGSAQDFLLFLHTNGIGSVIVIQSTFPKDIADLWKKVTSKFSVHLRRICKTIPCCKSCTQPVAISSILCMDIILPKL